MQPGGERMGRMRGVAPIAAREGADTPFGIACRHRSLPVAQARSGGDAGGLPIQALETIHPGAQGGILWIALAQRVGRA